MPHRSVTGGITGPDVSVDVAGLEKRIGDFCAANAIADQAGWTTFVSAAFNGTNASGLSASTRAAMIQFFTNFIRFDP